jgi:hypothetical protein
MIEIAVPMTRIYPPLGARSGASSVDVARDRRASTGLRSDRRSGPPFGSPLLPRKAATPVRSRGARGLWGKSPPLSTYPEACGLMHEGLVSTQQSVGPACVNTRPLAPGQEHSPGRTGTVYVRQAPSPQEEEDAV